MGWQLARNGMACVHVNERAKGNGGCDPRRMCDDSNSGFACGACGDGYEYIPLGACVDVDEDDDVDNSCPHETNADRVESDVRVYVDAAALGTQMKGTYSVTQDGCTATYHVLAMYPATDCTGEDGGPDQSVCDDPASGISPDFPVVCDPALLLCVLDADVDADLPVLKK